MTSAVIAFGANLSRDGNGPEKTLGIALDAIQHCKSIDVGSVSKFYRSPAVPHESGPDFVNGAALVQTTLGPEALLGVLHDIEDRLGRRRDARWAPRVVDLDLIGLGDLVLPDPATEAAWRTLEPGDAQTRWPEGLILPHPRMAERAFVLVPMAEIAPDWRHPATGLTVTEMLAALDPAARAAVRPIDPGESDRKA